MPCPACPEKRRYRPFFMLVFPLLFVACVVAALWVILSTREWYLAIPFTLLAVGLFPLMRWTLIWLSTPEERRLFALSMNREPIVGLLRAIFAKRQEPPPPATGTLPSVEESLPKPKLTAKPRKRRVSPKSASEIQPDLEQASPVAVPEAACEDNERDASA